MFEVDAPLGSRMYLGVGSSLAQGRKLNTVPELALQFQNEVRDSSQIIIGTHLNPDGDALGSALAMSHYLDGLKIANEVLCHHPAPKNLQFLPGVDRVRQVPKFEKPDLAIVLDLDAIDRLGSTEPVFASCPRMIVIDHHVAHQAPGDLRIVDVSAPATSVILTRLFIELGVTITPQMATCLLTGIITDTGSFKFRNTTPESLSLSALLLENGGDINLVSEEIFQRKPLASTRLLGHMLDTMRLECGNQIALGVLTRDDFEYAMAADEDTEGFVNEMLSIDSVKVAANLRQPKGGRVRCSIRSREEIDVAQVAREFGGGGHKNAAGCTFDGTIEECETILMSRLKLCLASCP
jgi:phosphoesterase RecJ-like protein